MDSTTLTISLGALISAMVTLVGAVTAWVTVRLTVKRHADELEEAKRERQSHDRRLDSIERWRERIRGAQQVQRQDTDRVLLPSADTRSDLHRQSDM